MERKQKEGVIYHFSLVCKCAVVVLFSLATPLHAKNDETGLTLVIPFFDKGEASEGFWHDSASWMEVWNRKLLLDNAKMPVNWMLPLGDLEDVQSLSLEKVKGLDRTSLTAIKQKYGAQRAVIAYVREEKNRIFTQMIFVDDTLGRVLSDGQIFTLDGEVEEIWLKAVEANVKAMEESQHFTALYQAKGDQLEAVLHFRSMAEYFEFKKRIEAVDFAQDAKLLSLKRDHARWKLFYKKEIAGFISFLYNNGVILKDLHGAWHLSLRR